MIYSDKQEVSHFNDCHTALKGTNALMLDMDYGQVSYLVQALGAVEGAKVSRMWL